MTSLTWADVRARRLVRHHLVTPAPRDALVDVVGALCGVHAQIGASAELALGLRVRGATARELRTELWQKRRLVRTYGIRGTVHLFPAPELPMWLAALDSNTPPQRSRERSGLPASRLAMVIDAIGDALDGRRLTRAELGEEVARRLGSWAVADGDVAFGGRPQPRWQAALGAAAVAGALCYGPPSGSRVTFVRPDQWLGRWHTVDGAGALAEVLRRYLRAYGPVTEKEFAQWFSMDEDAAGRLFRSLGDDLEQVAVEGHRSWQLAGDSLDTDPAPDATAVHLLPRFDIFLVGSHPRDELVPPAIVRRASSHPKKASWAPSARPMFTGTMAVLLVGGRAAGFWELRRRSRRADITVESFVDLRRDQLERLDRIAGRIGEVLGAEASLSLGPVASGPHL